MRVAALRLWPADWLEDEEGGGQPVSQPVHVPTACTAYTQRTTSKQRGTQRFLTNFSVQSCSTRGSYIFIYALTCTKSCSCKSDVHSVPTYREVLSKLKCTHTALLYRCNMCRKPVSMKHIRMLHTYRCVIHNTQLEQVCNIRTFVYTKDVAIWCEGPSGGF